MIVDGGWFVRWVLGNWNDMLTIFNVVGVIIAAVVGYYRIKEIRGQAASLVINTSNARYHEAGGEYTDGLTRYRIPLDVKNDGRDSAYILSAELELEGQSKLFDLGVYDGGMFPSFSQLEIEGKEKRCIEFGMTEMIEHNGEPLSARVSLDTSVGMIERDVKLSPPN